MAWHTSQPLRLTRTEYTRARPPVKVEPLWAPLLCIILILIVIHHLTHLTVTGNARSHHTPGPSLLVIFMFASDIDHWADQQQLMHCTQTVHVAQCTHFPCNSMHCKTCNWIWHEAKSINESGNQRGIKEYFNRLIKRLDELLVCCAQANHPIADKICWVIERCWDKCILSESNRIEMYASN